MSLLRIYAPLGAAPLRAQWALIDSKRPSQGEGTLAELPRGAARLQLVIPGTQVLIARARLPPGARRQAGPLLAFAVEERTAGEPDANQVGWLGAAGDEDMLAVVDRPGLERWREALAAIGLERFEVHAETLLLPRAAGEWTLAWNGAEGFVRIGAIEGAATDSGDQASPPLSLRMLLEEARARGARPGAIALYGISPDLEAWQRELDVSLKFKGAWDWRSAPQEAGTALAQERRPWRIAPATLAKLRPAAWIAGAALAIHAASLVADWTLLGGEQRRLRGEMEARFRAAFPEAVAVVDPPLQMRRQLAAARQRAGVPDGGDFAPMLEKLAIGLKELPAGALRTVSYESGRITLELAPIDEAPLRRAAASLRGAGLIVDVTGQKLITVRVP